MKSEPIWGPSWAPHRFRPNAFKIIHGLVGAGLVADVCSVAGADLAAGIVLGAGVRWIPRTILAPWRHAGWGS